jgi:hypothetical protein
MLDIGTYETSLILFIVGFGVLYLVVNEYEKRQKHRHLQRIDDSWTQLEHAFNSLELCLRGDHQLDEADWERTINEDLSRGKIALKTLKPRNGFGRRRSRSSVRPVEQET